MEILQSENLTLGQALAYLRSEKVFGRDYSENLSKNNLEYLNQLKEQAIELQKKRDFQDLLFIARDVLRIDNIDQKEHLDFFLNLFLVDTTDKDCYKLANSLNNHFDWFEGFSRILNDFLLTYNGLKEKNMLRTK
ncbi:MAG: hypothetical protein D8M58_12310 [Calditrichaeota bacterium]|nr:MAG: hypothetical protein DWQ03_13095 [Calditrichota bacterium]MBL1206180.1 hypothetical protein [Calditrichota bacterium]NOG46005.1 hypothetical protein [Calditrichota bacterium]